MKTTLSFLLISLVTLTVFPFGSSAAGLESYDAIKAKYAGAQKVRILVVPGHDDEFFGTSFNGVREADVNLELAKTIRDYLVHDPNIEVTLARDEQGYNPNFLAYFNENKDLIRKTVASQAAAIKLAMTNGEIIVDSQVPHANAVDQVAQQLYGLNSWTDHENFDLVLHVHFNDYGSRYSDKEGKYSGYSIYVPDQKLLNATTSKYFGDAIGKRLMTTLYKSDQTSEKKEADLYGAIPDFYLIAMGAYKTTQAPRALVEYSYIYEPQLQSPFTLVTAHMMARATASGIQDFLAGKKVSTAKNIEYGWDKTLGVSKVADQDVLMLQYGLSELGFYPAKGLTRASCPFSGIFGTCTKKAVMAFQASRGLSQTGGVGPGTRKALNTIFR
ncbi:TPA: hypothetical protein DCQ44_00645 [Candidatus Taylorbacteria bacterium]|nr:hypothetical protein [Candidatus Taylorbacteria bacterium]